MKNIKRAVVFIRVRSSGSDGVAATEQQITWQRQVCEQAAQQLRATIAHEYVERGGTDRVERRPIVREMLADLEAFHDIDYVITYSHDRLARRIADALSIDQAITAAGAIVVTPDEVNNKSLSPLGHNSMRKIRLAFADAANRERKEIRYGTQNR